MGKNKTERKAPVGKSLSIRKLPPDDPIYTRGFIIGGKNSSHFPENTHEKKSGSESQKPSKKGGSTDKQ